MCLSPVGRGYVVLSELALSSKHENAREKDVRRLREGSLDHMPFVQLIHIQHIPTLHGDSGKASRPGQARSETSNIENPPAEAA